MSTIVVLDRPDLVQGDALVPDQDQRATLDHPASFSSSANREPIFLLVSVLIVSPLAGFLPVGTDTLKRADSLARDLSLLR
jgi:hypothetical protein